jgi:hypothetical protein
VAHKTEIMAVRITTVPDGGGEVTFAKELSDPMNPWIPFFVEEDTMWLYRHVYQPLTVPYDREREAP